MTRLLPLLCLTILPGCKLLLGPPLRPGWWDFTFTGMDLTPECDDAPLDYTGDTVVESVDLGWPRMQELSVGMFRANNSDLELGDSTGFDLIFDGERSFSTYGRDVSLPLNDDRCLSQADITFEIDDRESLYGSVVTDDLRCADTGCRARLWLEGEWVERN